MGPETLGTTIINPGFNPSRDPKVARLKQLAAEMIDIIDLDHEGRNSGSDKMKEMAINNILIAQMCAVKAVIFKKPE